MSSGSGQGNSQGNSGASTSQPDTATSGAMTAQSQTTGGSASENLRYDLISTIYHAHKSASSIQQYIQDANQAGNSEAARFFQSLANEDQQRAQRAQNLLTRLGGSSSSTSSGGATQ